MGIKDLWPILTPYAERKPITELRGKIVAIDLAGWVCESLNVVDYFVHPRHHLKNLFFRTCYLIWEEVTPVFVLEGVAPKLKNQVIAKRNELQFRGVKPKANPLSQTQKATSKSSQDDSKATNEKGRTRFNHVLKQCETLLQSMGIQCVQAPGEAEAYCAFLNKHGLVDGVISQDSDCFAYGAVRVYRNFSVSTQGSQAAQGGAVDIYDIRTVREKMDIGQHKIIVMGLLCGCDYCPDGVGGIGRDSVLKLFNRYNDTEILRRIRSWRNEDDKYTALEMRVDDKTICSNCGHIGRTQMHTKSGCGLCRTNRGCDESLWKEERLSLKAELVLRKKALADPNFPAEGIISEFLTEPATVPALKLNWKQPNIVKFIQHCGRLLQWPEIYCFQKFFPILTRWQMRHARELKATAAVRYVEPKQLLKKRTKKGVPSIELLWEDRCGFFDGLLPEEQLKEFETQHPQGIAELWTTIEPLHMLQEAYPDLLTAFLQAKEKPKAKPKAKSKSKSKKPPKASVREKYKENMATGSLENLSDLQTAVDDIEKSIKPRRPRKPSKKQAGLQLIDRYFKQSTAGNSEAPLPASAIALAKTKMPLLCSTPIRRHILSDSENDEIDEMSNLTNVVDSIVKGSPEARLKTHDGHQLLYEAIPMDLSRLVNERHIDDLDIVVQKRNLSIQNTSRLPISKRISLDDSFDLLVNNPQMKVSDLMQRRVAMPQSPLITHVDRFRLRNMGESRESFTEVETDIYRASCTFFHATTDDADAFEQLMEQSFSKQASDTSDSGATDDADIEQIE